MIRVAVDVAGVGRVVMEIDPADVPGAHDDEDAAIRVADWARDVQYQTERLAVNRKAQVRRQGERVLISVTP